MSRVHYQYGWHGQEEYVLSGGLDHMVLVRVHVAWCNWPCCFLKAAGCSTTGIASWQCGGM